jgi:hypothetical protein
MPRLVRASWRRYSPRCMYATTALSHCQLYHTSFSPASSSFIRYSCHVFTQTPLTLLICQLVSLHTLTSTCYCGLFNSYIIAVLQYRGQTLMYFNVLLLYCNHYTMITICQFQNNFCTIHDFLYIIKCAFNTYVYNH